MSTVTRKVSGTPGPGPGSSDSQLRTFLVSPLYFPLNGHVLALLLVQGQASVHPLEWMASPQIAKPRGIARMNQAARKAPGLWDGGIGAESQEEVPFWSKFQAPFGPVSVSYVLWLLASGWSYT